MFSTPSPSVLLAHTLVPRGSWADGCVSKPSKFHDSSLWRWSRWLLSQFWTYTFFTEHNSLVSTEKKESIFFISLPWKIPASLHFEGRTDNSLMEELLQPRLFGVAAGACAAWASALPGGRAGAALGKRLCFFASAESAASVRGWLFVGGTKSGYYFKRNSHRKNVGFKINKCAHGSWIKL